MGVIKGGTRSLDYSSCGELGGLTSRPMPGTAWSHVIAPVIPSLNVLTKFP